LLIVMDWPFRLISFSRFLILEEKFHFNNWADQGKPGY
jgi:hypothetical protein